MVAMGRQGDIVSHHHHLHRDPLGARDLGREAEVEAVAGVVFHDQQHAGRAGDGTDGIQHGVGGRRGEYFAGHGRAEHAGANVTAVCRLMAGAATRNQRDFAACGSLAGVGAQHDVLALQERQVRVQCGQAGQHVGDDMGDVVDEFLHVSLVLVLCRSDGNHVRWLREF